MCDQSIILQFLHRGMSKFQIKDMCEHADSNTLLLAYSGNPRCLVVHGTKWQSQYDLVDHISAQKLSKAVQITCQRVAAPLKGLHAAPILIRKPSDPVAKFWASDKPAGKLERTSSRFPQ